MAGLAIDQGMMMYIIVFFIMAIVIVYLVGYILKSKPKSTAITKDQYQRLVADLTVSGKNNRLRGIKWIQYSGDSTHPALEKYARYRGHIAHSNGLILLWKVKWYTPMRIQIVPWPLVANWNGPTFTIIGNGAIKDGYFFRTVIPRDYVIDGHTAYQYDRMVDDMIMLLLAEQGIHDVMEQSFFETMVATSSGSGRQREDLLMKPDYITVEEEPREMGQEPEG